jgi:hypothetical protein
MVWSVRVRFKCSPLESGSLRHERSTTLDLKSDSHDVRGSEMRSHKEIQGRNQGVYGEFSKKFTSRFAIFWSPWVFGCVPSGWKSTSPLHGELACPLHQIKPSQRGVSPLAQL